MDRHELKASIEEGCVFEFARSGGPGGQNVNKVNSKALGRLRLGDLRGLSEAERARLLMVLGPRLTAAGELLVQASEERDQHRNREAALARLLALVAGAAALPKRRVPTRPGKAARERRLSVKHIRASVKESRRKSGED